MIVYDAQHKAIELGEAVGHGGEATVYRLAGQANRLAKIYEPEPRPTYASKLDWMVRFPPDNPTAWLEHASLAWPGGLLYDSKRQLKGYWMPYIQRAVSILEVFNPRRRSVILPQFDRRYLLRTARNLAVALSALHKRGYVAGDLNESNILVTQTALVTLIDTDSFQVSEDHEGSLVVHPCPVGKGEYTPPELQGKALAEVIRQPSHDAFGLAVLIFQLLMDGSHPFRAQWMAPGDPPPMEVRIANGAYPYVEAPQYPVRPPKNALGIETLHPWLVDLFRRCFVDGHRDPRWRPGPDLWVHALSEVEQSLVLCSEGHYYSGHLESCPYCPRDQQKKQAEASKQAASRSPGKRSTWNPRPKPNWGIPTWQPAQPRTPPPRAAAPPPGRAQAVPPARAAGTPTPAPGARPPVSATSGPAAAAKPGATARAATPAPARAKSAAPAAASSAQTARSSNPFTGWPSSFPSSQNSSVPSIRISPSGGVSMYGFPSRRSLRNWTFTPPGGLQNWARTRAYKTMSVGGAQGALLGALPGIGIGLASWSAGNPLPWALLFSLGGIAGGLARGWVPGHRLASLIGQWIGWKRFWEALGLVGGAIGGFMVGLLFVWMIVPVFLGLILGAQGGLYLGRKIYTAGDKLGWERIWGVLSASGFGLLGYGVGQVLGVTIQTLLGAYLTGQMMAASSETLVWALIWTLAGAVTSGLGGALAGLLTDMIGRFTGLVD